MEKLYRRQLEAILNPEFKQEYEFPTLAGSYLHMKNPALELVKFLCHVFALSEKRSKEVRILKKLLLIFDVRDFSKDATFRNPCTSLKLPHVICDYCNHIRDIDLCREEINIWNCLNCHKAYNKIALEGDY